MLHIRSIPLCGGPISRSRTHIEGKRGCMRGDVNLRPRKSRFAVVDVSADESAAAMGAEPWPSLDLDLDGGLDGDQAWEGRCGFQRRGPLRSQRGDTHPTSASVVPHVHHHCYPLCPQCRLRPRLDTPCVSAALRRYPMPVMVTLATRLSGHHDQSHLRRPIPQRS